MELPCEKPAITEHCFATEHCFHNLVCRLDTKGKMQPRAHKSQRSIPEERDLLCGAAVSCFARSWSVKYTKGQRKPIVGYRSVKFVMGVQRLSYAALQQRIVCSLQSVFSVHFVSPSSGNIQSLLLFLKSDWNKVHSVRWESLQHLDSNCSLGLHKSCGYRGKRMNVVSVLARLQLLCMIRTSIANMLNMSIDASVYIPILTEKDGDVKKKRND